MRRIIYTSTSTEPKASAEAAAILRVSRELNGIDGVTGLLCACHDRYLQAFEGPEESVALTLARIERDPRHHSIEILSDAEADAREFGDWAMAYVDDGQTDELLGERMTVLLSGVSDDLAERFRGFVAPPEH